MFQILQNKVIRFILGLPYSYPENNEKKTITVLIPAYNEEKTIGDTIRSLKNQTRLPDEILVVDDCSQDRTGRIVKSLGARVIRTRKNSGSKSQAQNFGLPYISSDTVVTIDADTTLHPEAIENVVKSLSDPNVASACGMVVPQRIKTIWEKARFIEYLFGLWLAKGAQSNLGTVLVSSGCFSAFRTKELQEKGFKERTIAEDMDLTWEFLFEGRRIAYMPKAICYPLDPPNYKIYKDQLDRWYRAFFQNIAVHKRDFLKCKRLACLAGWYVGEVLLGPVMWILFPLFIWQGGQIGSSVIVSHWILVGVISVFCAHRLRKKLLAMQSIPCYFLISFFNTILFWRAFFLEWILKRKLQTWKKGH